MLPSLLPALNLAVETALVFGVVLLAAACVSAPFRVFLCRCAFVVALGAPWTLCIGAPKASMVTLPSAQDLTTPASTWLTHQGVSGADQAESVVGLAAVAWIAGAVIVLVRYLLSLRVLAHAFAAGVPIPGPLHARLSSLRQRLALRAPVAVRLSDRVPTPCTFGWLRPKVLIPVAAQADGFDSILAHELCHVRSRDALWLMLAQIACAIHWFNPLVWASARRHSHDIELVCDDAAARTGMGVEAYASALVRAACDLVRPSVSAAATMSGHGLASRVRALLGRAQPLARPALGFKIAAIGCSLAALFAFSAADLVSAHASEVDAMLSGGNAIEPGHGRVQLRVPEHVEVRADAIGFACWGAARCQFEEPLGAEILLRASADRSGVFIWDGCHASTDAGACRVRVGETVQRVSVRLRR